MSTLESASVAHQARMSPFEPGTLVDLLEWRAEQQAEQPAFTFLVDGEADALTLTYGQLAQHACAVAAMLQGVSGPGDRALLLYPPGLDYIVAFFGCLYAGVIPVPAYPPRPNKPTPRLQAILRDSQATIVLTSSAMLSQAQRSLGITPDHAGLTWLTTDTLSLSMAAAWHKPILSSSTLAFLQYTSGSTATPKGVMLTHGNLLANQRMITAAFQHNEQTTVVGWLPLYHDMGLIGNVLQPLYLGRPCILMSPMHFLQRPIRWLRAITEYQATTSGGPNFAYELCLQHITPEQYPTLDLSSWQLAFNGAEPIRATTMARFASAFARCGFRREAFYPCYGLAEATLIVSGGAPGAGPVVQAFQPTTQAHDQMGAAPPDHAHTHTLVGCGQALLDEQIAIAHPSFLTPCPPGAVGEIWVAGPNIGQGYWNQPEQTRDTFQAHLADTGAGPFLRTGDLGFVAQGQLFVTGRLKDLIIIRGRNHYPQDIELTVEHSHTALQPGASAAFTIEHDSQERLVVVAELQRQARKVASGAVAAAIRQAVVEQHELQVHAVVLLKPGSIPKTSSGKIQRHACRDQFLSGELEIIGQSILANVESLPDAARLDRATLLALDSSDRQQHLMLYLQQVVARVLQIDPAQLDPQPSLSALGLDSLMAVELQNQIEVDLGIVLPMVAFLQDSNLVQLAQQGLAQLEGTAAAPLVPFELLPANDPLMPLSYGQRALWFLWRLAPESAAYNIASAFRIKTELDVAALQRAFQRLVDRHTVLRTTFTAPHGEPLQQVHVQRPIWFEAVPAANWNAEALEQHLTTEAHRPFDLEHGPLLRVHLFAHDACEHTLLLVLHHIVADFWSMEVLTRELAQLYSAERSGRSATPGPVDTPLPLDYAQYAHWQRGLLDGARGEQLWNFWRQQLAGPLPVLDLAAMEQRPPIQTDRGHAQRLKLSHDLARRLNAFSRAQHTTLYMTLLAAFQALLFRYTEQEDVLIGSPTAGRSRAELAELVGYFANPIVLRADLRGDPTVTELLARTRQTVLSAFAHQEYPFALLVERLQPQRDPSHSPIFQAMFIFQRARHASDARLTPVALGDAVARMELGGLSLEALPLEQHIAQFDLTLRMAEVQDGLLAALEYNTDLFDDAMMTQMLAQLPIILEGMVATPEQRLSAIIAPIPAQRLRLGVAATFTAEPLAEPLSYLLEQISVRTRIRFADYNQVFQQVLDPTSLLNTNREGINIILLRLEDWLGTQTGSAAERTDELARNATEFLDALQSTLSQGSAPCILGVCPPSTAAEADCKLRAALAAQTQAILEHAARLPGMYLIDTSSLAERYQVQQVTDATTDAAAHIPYTPAFFAALGMALARKISALISPPVKVIALDCDETLWGGICGEDGPNGIRLDPAYLALQQFMVAQASSGKILCLCSKNNPADVAAVFEQRTEMPLRLDQIVASRLNWESKADNLRALAAELQLGLDSFIFVDDNPVECAEVQASCPEVLTLQLPADPAARPALLEAVWAFEQLAITDEDAQRTRLYQQQRQRGAFEATAPSIDAFLDGLNLEIAITPVTAQQIERIAQLTQRTNQFNATTIRRSASDVQHLLATGTLECWAVEVQDRFGAYGLVGALMFTVAADTLRVDSFLLSCRALGKHVEDTMLVKLVQLARQRGCHAVLLPYRATAKNLPFLQFLQRVGAETLRSSDDGLVAAYPTTLLDDWPNLTQTSYGYRFTGVTAAHEQAADTAKRAARSTVAGMRVSPAVMKRIATELQSADQIVAALQARRQRWQPMPDHAYVAPRTAVEEALARIWTHVLGVERVGIHDTFFALGGHSLLATQVVSQIRDTFQTVIPLHQFFEAPTIAGLAVLIETTPADDQDDLAKIAQMLQQIEQLSLDEVEALLAAQDALEFTSTTRSERE